MRAHQAAKLLYAVC